MASSSIARTTLVCSWLFTALATLSVLIQVLHMQKRHSVGLDDYILFIAFGISILLVAQTTWAVVDEGQGVPESELLGHPYDDFKIVAKSVFANEILWGCVNTLLRVSALILSRKLFGVINWARLLTDIGIFLNVGFYYHFLSGALVTVLRLKELHLVSSTDLTYGKGYLSLLSNVGALTGIIGCCGPALSAFFGQYHRTMFQRTATRIGSIYNAATSWFEPRLPTLSFNDKVFVSIHDNPSINEIDPSTLEKQISPFTGADSREPNCPLSTEVHSTAEEVNYISWADKGLEAMEEIDITDYDGKE
ncbi:hypothetical protein UA08_09235 [Talaromyces atroroseus]|uniref:Rhodopsin domain-containing protein n=1 Tax=Talaromyces atroroseus TaxID=1441469 RepID=A0A1Q5Q6Y8_TALAT|nr:hypothetical protein UA08_09235 [Talaromyces atroroseus]OKL55543.1 hypothetical protein UA08_09235 [Talaromyces atroroseus]